MNIRVEFQGTERSDSADGSFVFYFGEEELLKVKEEDDTEVAASKQQPFDGLSCKAFKLDMMKQQSEQVALAKEKRAAAAAKEEAGRE